MQVSRPEPTTVIIASGEICSPDISREELRDAIQAAVDAVQRPEIILPDEEGEG